MKDKINTLLDLLQGTESVEFSRFHTIREDDKEYNGKPRIELHLTDWYKPIFCDSWDECIDKAIDFMKGETEMNYEEKYKEALGWMRSIYPTMQGVDKEDAEHYFPELKESEDEKIRKEIIFFFEQEIPQCSIEEHKEYMRKWISWLEKQGEKESKRIDFADWDILNYIKDIVREHVKRDEEFNEIDNWLTTHYQEQKPAWSEEDGEMLLMCSDAIAASYAADYYTAEEMHKMQDWLKSLKPWNPTKEQMEALKCSYKSYIIDGKERRTLESLYNDLKSL